MEGTDKDAITRQMEQLTQVSHKLAEEVYKRTAEQQAASAGGEAAGGTSEKKPDEDVVDADFEEVKK
jgi:molecular chaperone DnaK